MKEKLLSLAQAILKDRYFLLLGVFTLFLAIIISIVLALSVQVGERQIVTHYTAFGETNFYFDQWYYLINFVLFGLIVSILNTLVAIKLFVIKGRAIAIMYLWFAVGVLLMGSVTANMIFNLRNLL
jgi:hypothetical protein